MTIDSQISAIITNRQQRLDGVKERIARWHCLNDALVELEAAVALPDQGLVGTGGTSSVLNRLWDSNARGRISERIRTWECVRNRFSRQTINIGVSGQRKAGKSTLLQTMTGLSAKEIPAGRDECTAVPSRIYHDQDFEAVVTFHTWESFREKALAPLYDILAKGPTPANDTAFERELLKPSGGQNPESPALLSAEKNLKDIHRFFNSYRDLLKGGTKSINREEIPDYVSLPPPGLGESNPRRWHFAVRNCVLRTRFPETSVSALGLIDLPGTGSPIKNVDSNRLEGIQDDTDVAIMIKPAAEVDRMTTWGVEDNLALEQLINAASKIGVTFPSDFILVLVNGSDRSRIPIDVGIIDREINVRGKTYRILEADARNRSEVTANVLNPVLEHLAARLPAMDGQVWNYAIDQDRKETESLSSAFDTLSAQIQSAGIPPSAEKLVYEIANKLRDNLADGLLKIENKYNFREAREGKTEWQKRFATELEKLSAHLKTNWRQSYFDSKWTEATRLELARSDRDEAYVLAEETRHCRAALRKELGELDAIFRVEMKKMWDDTGRALRDVSGQLLSAESNGEHAIKRFRDLCRSSGCQCLVTACDAVLAENINLQFNFLHCIAQVMEDYLDPKKLVKQWLDGSGKETRNEDPSGRAEVLKLELSARCGVAIDETKKAIQGSAQVVDQILYAIIDNGSDLFIRAKGIENEYHELVRAKGAEIDPDRFGRIEHDNKAYKIRNEATRKVRLALSALSVK